MVPQTYQDATIKLGATAFQDVKSLSIKLQIADEVYNATCRQMEIAQSSLTIQSIATAKGEINVKGLDIPVQVTKAILENVPDIDTQWVTPHLGNHQSDKNPWADVFDNALKGIQFIDPANISDHIANSVKYRLRLPS